MNPEKNLCKRESNPASGTLEADALTTRRTMRSPPRRNANGNVMYIKRQQQHIHKHIILRMRTIATIMAVIHDKRVCSNDPYWPYLHFCCCCCCCCCCCSHLPYIINHCDYLGLKQHDCTNYKLSRNPVTLSDDRGHSYWYQSVVCSCLSTFQV